MKSTNTRQLVLGGLTAAIYVALGLTFAPISFGPAQLRVAEALTLLPVFTPSAIWGLTVGCAITNAIGLFTGATILGPIDILLGSLTTLVAAWLTRLLRKSTLRGLPVLSSLPPILLNAVVVGGELTFFLYGGGFEPTLFFGQAALIALGQLLACGGIGLFMVYTLQKLGLDKKIFS